MKNFNKFTALIFSTSLMLVLFGCPQPNQPNKSNEEPKYKYTKTWYVKDDTRYHGKLVYNYNTNLKNFKYDTEGTVTYYSDNLPPKTLHFVYEISEETLGGKSVIDNGKNFFSFSSEASDLNILNPDYTEMVDPRFCYDDQSLNAWYDLMGSNYDEEWNKSVYGNVTVLALVSTPVTDGGSSGGSGGSGGASSLDGDYAFNDSYNGTITLSGGNWSYSGNKTGVAANTGTYTVDGNKITFNWTIQSGGNDIPVSETVTVDNSGTSSTWTTTGYSLFSMFFGTTNQTYSLEYTAE